MGNLPDQVKGLLLTASGVVLLSPDSLFVRLIAIDQWTMIFWRGILFVVSLGIFLALSHGREAPARCREIGGMGLAIASLFTVSSILFIIALSNTSVANTLIIVSAAPVFSAMFNRIFLAESVAPRTWGAIVCAMAGIAVIVSDRGGGDGRLGDAAALGAALSIAISLSLLRRTRSRGLIPTMALSGLMSAVVVLPLAAPFALDAVQAGLMALLGLVILPIAIVLTLLGPRYLPAPEVGLILLLETVLGPFWVWLALGEDPGVRALIGGAIVIGALVVHSALGLRGERAATEN